ncbi:MAG TPA: AGE family epimerase/isomerase [Thermoguttaceae bacterium]|nr:AGE family epimerase/isomerase [Thermoguttaceae bacterium]
MNSRRDYAKLAADGGSGGTGPWVAPRGQAASEDRPLPNGAAVLPTSIAGMTLEQLRDDYHDRLFNQYLPFWEKGGYDRELGGFMCELNDDGSVAGDEKCILFQGRGIWIYSFLYNHFGNDRSWLDVARKSKDFMIDHMYAGRGKWRERVRRDGSETGVLGTNVYGGLYAAAGLIEYYKATQEKKCLELAKESIWAAVRAYDDPAYTGALIPGDDYVEVPRGARSQGHSMMIVWPGTQLLQVDNDPRAAELVAKHVDLIVNKFWNPEYGIVNEYLLHDYRRVPGAETYMYSGHSLETLWMVADEALRIKERKLFDTAFGRFHRLLEMCWDYVFEGWASDDFLVFADGKHPGGPKYDVKTMWAHCEILLACMMCLEYTGATWAKEWYERTRAYALRTMPVAGHGVWRQAVDRLGKDLQRAGTSAKRKCNFHPPRYMMRNILSLERMIEHRGALTGFPG